MTITTVVEKSSGFDIENLNLTRLLESIKDVRLVVVQDKDTDSLLRKSTTGKLETLEVDSNVVLFFNGIKAYNPPRGGSSPDSGATYPIWDEDTGILFQKLKAGLVTSCNFHTKGPEQHYPVPHPLSGYFKMCECDYLGKYYKGSRILEKGKLSTAELFICHRGTALINDTYNIILMQPGVGTSDHHYPEYCIRDLYFLPEKCISYVK